VFRAEEGGKPDAPRLVEQVRGVSQAPVHCRGVAHETHRKPPQGGETFPGEHVEARCDPHLMIPRRKANLMSSARLWMSSFSWALV